MNATLSRSSWLACTLAALSVASASAPALEVTFVDDAAITQPFRFGFELNTQPRPTDPERDGDAYGFVIDPDRTGMDQFLDGLKLRADILGVAGVDELFTAYNVGGLGTLVRDMALETAAARLDFESLGPGAKAREEAAGTLGPGWHLVRSKLRINVNRDKQAGVIDVSSLKRHVDALCNDHNGWKRVDRRWLVAVLDGGFREWHGKPGVANPYRLFATGQAIRMLSYYESDPYCEGTTAQPLKLVKVLLPNGKRDPRYKYYGVTANACIDILFKAKPNNDITLISKPGDVLFCARGCAIPGIDATR